MNRRKFILGSAAMAAILTARRAFGFDRATQTGTQPAKLPKLSTLAMLEAMRSDGSLAAQIMAEGEREYTRQGLHRALNLSKDPVTVADSAGLNPSTAFGQYVTDEGFRSQVMEPAAWDGSFKAAQDFVMAAVFSLGARAWGSAQSNGQGPVMAPHVLVIVNSQVATCLSGSVEFRAIQTAHRPGSWHPDHLPYEIGRMGVMAIVVDPNMPWPDTRFTAYCNGVAITSGVFLGRGLGVLV